VEKQQILHIVKCLSVAFVYPACKAHASYYIIICRVPGSTIYFSHLINGTIKKNIEHKMLVLILCTTLIQNPSHSAKYSARSYAFIHIHVKYPLFLSDFNEAWILPTNFRKIPKCKITWKSVQWEPSSMRTDKQVRRSYYSLFAILRTCLKTHLDRIRGAATYRQRQRLQYRQKYE